MPVRLTMGSPTLRWKGFVRKRRRDGLHGLAIQWGPVGDVGFVAETMGGQDVVIADAIPQRIHSCLEVLDRMLQSSDSVVGSHVEYNRNGKTVDLSEMDLISKVLNALGIRDKTKVKATVTLSEMGMDSLMATVVKNIINSECHRAICKKTLNNMTLNDLKQLQLK